MSKPSNARALGSTWRLWWGEKKRKQEEYLLGNLPRRGLRGEEKGKESRVRERVGVGYVVGWGGEALAKFAPRNKRYMNMKMREASEQTTSVGEHGLLEVSHDISRGCTKQKSRQSERTTSTEAKQEQKPKRAPAGRAKRDERDEPERPKRTRAAKTSNTESGSHEDTAKRNTQTDVPTSPT